MRTRTYLFPLLALGLAVAPAAAQGDGNSLPPAPVVPAPGPMTGTAATVNGQAIPEAAVQRGLRRVDPVRCAEARPAILDFLIENALIDQYLAQLKVEPDKKDVEARVEKIYAEIKKGDEKVEDVLKKLMLTEAEFRAQVEADVRWDKFANDQATDDKLKKYFEANRESFDGSQVRARHILLTPAPTDAAATERAVTALRTYKKQAEEAANAAVSKLPANADAFTKKKTYNDNLEAEFAKAARENSCCKSKQAGGDLGWFERTNMVELFARTAFAQEPYQIGEPVKTQFGYHLILAIERRPGHDVKFEDVKDRVKEVYSDRLREAVVAAMRPRAQIEITPPKQ